MYKPLLKAACVVTVFVTTSHSWSMADEPNSNLRADRLVAWCIVPFDARQRGPAERAKMVKELGLKRVAYDWRKQHVGEFEQEIVEYTKSGIEFFAFWSWHDAIEPLIQKHSIKPQIWMMCRNPSGENAEQRISAAAQSLMPMVERTKRLGLKLGIYNHGGWGGEPENMVAVCDFLAEHHGANHVGIVYNFHHGHTHIKKFEQHLQKMKPHLLCLNLNGMVSEEVLASDPSKKILPIGSGDQEVAMIKTIVRSGYAGPIGILDHRSDMDAKESLQQNLDGLEKVLEPSR